MAEQSRKASKGIQIEPVNDLVERLQRALDTTRATARSKALKEAARLRAELSKQLNPELSCLRGQSADTQALA